MKYLCAYLLIIAALASVSIVHAVQVNWIGPNSGDWEVANNWSSKPNLPGASDSAVIMAVTGGTIRHWIGDHTVYSMTCNRALNFTGGTLGINNSSSCTGLNLNGGYFLGAGALNLYGASNYWNLGTVANVGGFYVNNTATLEIGSQGNKSLKSRLINYGTVNYKGILDLDPNAFISNFGTMDVRDDYDFETLSNQSSIINYGTFKKSTTSGLTVIYPAFDNYGTVAADTGPLKFMGGGTSEDAFFTSNTDITFDNEIYTIFGDCEAYGGGTFTLGAGAILSVEGASRMNCGFLKGFKFAGGVLTGYGQLINTSLLDWSGGWLFNSGCITNEGSMNITGSTTKYMDAGILGNKNWILHKGKGSLKLTNTSNIYNQTGGTYELQTDASILCPDASSTFHNGGTIKKDYSYGVSRLEPYYDTTGLVDVESGELILGGGGFLRDSGAYVNHLATLTFENGDFTVYGENQLSGSGVANMLGGSVTLSEGATFQAGMETSLSLAGSFFSGHGNLINTWNADWTSSIIGDQVHFRNLGTLSLTGDGLKILQNAQFYNENEVMHYDSGFVYLDEYSTIDNEPNKNYTFRGDGSIFGYGVLENAGTIHKDYSTGTSTIQPYYYGTAGVFDIQTGTISLIGGGEFYSGGANIAHLANLSLSGGDYGMHYDFTAFGGGSATLSADTMSFEYGATATFGLEDGLHINGVSTSGAGKIINTLNADWTSGTFADESALDNRSSLNITGSDNKYLQGGNLYNTGTIIHGGAGCISFSGASEIENRGNYYMRSDADFLCTDGLGAFTNAGTFRKDYSSAITNFQTAFNNEGLIDVATGLVRFTGGGNWLDGAAHLSTNTQLDLNYGTFNLDGVFQALGDGDVYLSGTLALAYGAQATFSTTKGLHITNGNIAGQGSVTCTSVGEWTGGTMANDAAFTNSGTFTIAGSAAKTLKRARFLNTDQLTFSGGTLEIDENSNLDNNGTSAVITIAGDYPIVGTGTINNYSTLKKSSGIDVSEIEAILNNWGTLDVASGVMAFRNPATQMVEGTLTTGKWIVRDRCVLDIGGDYAIRTNQAEVTLIGRAEFPQFYSISGNSGIIHLQQGAGLWTSGTFGSSGEMDMAGCNIYADKNTNTGNWHGWGTVKGNLTNRATLKPLYSSEGIAVTGTFSQTSTGTLHIEIGGRQAAQFGVINVSGSATLNGTLKLTLVNGFVPQRGDSFRVVASKTRSGKFTTITGQALSNGLYLNPVYTNSGVILVVGDLMPSLTEIPDAASAKKQTGGAWVSLPGTVSAVFADGFFVEDANRAGAVRVTTTQTFPSVGQRVQVAGQLNQFDMCLTLKTAQWAPLPEANAAVRPLIVSNRGIGGAALGLQAGVNGGRGVNNIGLLVKVVGKVNYLSSGVMAYIDDGSGLLDGNTLGFRGRQIMGMRVILSSTANIPTGAKLVTLTGISYRQLLSDVSQRAIIVKSVDSVTY